jgi:hypothetical protein
MLTLKTSKLLFLTRDILLNLRKVTPSVTSSLPSYLFLVSSFLLISLVLTTVAFPPYPLIDTTVPLAGFFAALSTAHLTCAGLSSFTLFGNWTFISFLPEITLAIMIVYLIWALALELAADRLPKALAIEC